MEMELNPSTGTGSGGGELQVAREEVRAPMWMDICVTGGLGLAVYIGPPIYYAVREGVVVWWPRVSKPVKALINRVQRRLEPMKRRRRNGSIIRVIADLLPDLVFGPTPRIFIAGLTPNSTAGSLGTVRESKMVDQSPEGLIVVAFELDGDVESECTEMAEDIDEDISSNPEGWDTDTFPLFAPGAHSTVCNTFKCSTPTKNLPDLCSQRNILNDSVCTDVTDNDENSGKTREEIADLKMIIQGLVHQMSVLNQNMTIRNNHADSTIRDNDLPPPPFMSSPSVSDFTLTLPPPPTFAQVVVKSNMCGPPPPPPPPMPALLSQGSCPIKIIKSNNKQSKELPKVAPSMMDVLKDLNNVKLKSICRSPGGTPVKDQKKRTSDKNSLEYALKKRFESMHTPPGSDNDESADKENDFEDSFLKNGDSPRKGRKSNRSSLTPLKPTNVLGERNFSNKTNGIPPFGPHLLKKRIQN